MRRELTVDAGCCKHVCANLEPQRKGVTIESKYILLNGSRRKYGMAWLEKGPQEAGQGQSLVK